MLLLLRLPSNSYYLKMFLDDEYLPNAILLEYIPNMQPLHWTNYTKERMDSFINGIREIHKARVQHSDVYPRNMIVVEDGHDHDQVARAIWIDFDRAQTFQTNPDLTEGQKEWITFFEYLLVTDMAGDMVC